MKNLNWEFIDESNDKGRLPADGYVIVINEANDNPSREYVELVYDIAEGPWKAHYSDDFGRNNPWAHHFFRSYKDSALNMFKTFLKRLEESNDTFSIAEWQKKSDEKDFVGLEIGIILQEEEYEANDGTVKTRLNVAKVVSADTIRRRDFKPFEKKTLERTADTFDFVPF